MKDKPLEKKTKVELIELVLALNEENIEMYDRIQNLELYLEFLRVKYPSAWKNLRKHFPGLPGHVNQKKEKAAE